MKLGDRVLVMDQGKIVQLDTPEKIKKEPANELFISSGTEFVVKN